MRMPSLMLVVALPLLVSETTAQPPPPPMGEHSHQCDDHPPTDSFFVTEDCDRSNSWGICRTVVEDGACSVRPDAFGNECAEEWGVRHCTDQEKENSGFGEDCRAPWIRCVGHENSEEEICYGDIGAPSGTPGAFVANLTGIACNGATAGSGVLFACIDEF